MYSYEIEQMIDARVQRLLQQDNEYLYANSPQAQRDREDEITAAVVREFEAGVARRLAGLRA